MNDFVKIKGNDNLVRDMSSKAIINCNMDEYENYKRRVNSSQEIKARLDEQDRVICEIQSDISDIKKMLTLLLAAK